jgi:hypothetical protein
MIVELISIEVTMIAGLVHPQDDGFDEAIETTQHVLRGHLLKIPRSDGMLDRFEQSILADALLAAKHQSVVDLLLRTLRPLSEPSNDVIGIIWKNFADVFEPRTGLTGITGDNRRRPDKDLNK